MKPIPKLMLDVMDRDEVVVTGERDVVAEVVDLGLCRYIESEGYVRALVHDPIPYRGREIANAAMRDVRCPSSFVR